MPTAENLWVNDSLNRKEEGEFLSNYLIKYYDQNSSSPFVLNINAEWGFGKTYFLKNLSKELKNKKHPVVYFDAWKNDYTDQPLLAFMSALEENLNPCFSGASKAKKKFKTTMTEYKNLLFPILAKKLTGMGVDELLDHYESESIDSAEIEETEEELNEEVSTVLTKFVERALQEHNNVNNSIDQFKQNMDKLLKHIDNRMESKKLPMFIFIDELDRCRPSYAIELLESIKHIFDIPGIIFVIATDSKQLAHSINAVYGEKFASERYLRRFFDQEYTLINPDSYSFTYYLFDKYELLENTKLYSPLSGDAYGDRNVLVQLYAGYADYFKLGLRDQEQVMLVLFSITLLWENRDKLHLGYLLFLIMLKQKSSESFEKYMDLVNKSQFPQVIPEHVNTSITFTSYERVGRSSYNNAILPVQSLINEYIKVLNVNAGTSIDFENESEQTIYNVYYQILNELPGSWSGRTPPVHSLNTYPNLVLQAGQLS